MKKIKLITYLLILLFGLLNLTNLIAADEILKEQFLNGKIEYKTKEGNKLYDGTVYYRTLKHNYKLPFKVLKKKNMDKIQEGIVAYQFIMEEATKLPSSLYTNLHLLPDSRLSLLVKDNIIGVIIIEDGLFGDPNSSIKYRNGVEITNAGEVLDGTGKIQLGPIELDIPIENKNEIIKNFGKGRVIQYQINDFEWSPELSKLISNLSPVIKFSGGVQISQTKVNGNIYFSFSLLDHPVKIGRIILPSFLTKENPITFKADIDYNGITDIFVMDEIKKAKSGSMTLSAQKNLKILLKANRFGFKYTYNGEFDYDLTALKKWLRNNSGEKFNKYIADNMKTINIEDWLAIKVIDKFYSREEILQYNKLLFTGLIGFRILYNPDEADKPKKDVGWKFLEPIIELKSRKFN